MSNNDRHLTAKAIALKQAPSFTKKRISVTTVKRRLATVDLNGRVARRKPLLRPENKKRRLEWAKAHADWTAEDWRKVIFSDESPFTLFQEGGKIYVRRRPAEEFLEECIEPTVKHGGGSIQVWGCFNYGSKGPLYRIQGIMDGEKYRQILIHHMAPFLKDLKGDLGVEPIFQQDNDPKHTCKKVKKYLENKKFKVLDWPSQSPDLNPIEHAWRQLKLAIYARTDHASNLDEVFEIAKEEWLKLPMANLEKLVNSMPKRIQEVIAAKGGHTGY
jgi:transposase